MLFLLEGHALERAQHDRVLFENETHAQSSQLANFNLPRHDRPYTAFLAVTAQDWPTDDEPVYFVSTRILAHRFLPDPSNRINNNILFLILFASKVSETRQVQLKLDSGTIMPVEPTVA